MREYETTFIVQPEISEEGTQAILERLDGVLERHDEPRLCLEDHGKRKLAYEIRKFHKGHYYTLRYLGQGKAVKDLERMLRIEESVLRFLTVMADDKVTDIEARKAEAAQFEAEQARKAAEKAAREAEEARAREEAEREAAARAAREREEEEQKAAESGAEETSATSEGEAPADETDSGGEDAETTEAQGDRT